jgi:hypothetical protein
MERTSEKTKANSHHHQKSFLIKQRHSKEKSQEQQSTGSRKESTLGDTGSLFFTIEYSDSFDAPLENHVYHIFILGIQRFVLPQEHELHLNTVEAYHYLGKVDR